jgi:hypothetical protein
VAMPRLVFGKAREGGAGAADMLVWQEAMGPAADDVFDGLVGRRRGEPFGHDRRYGSRLRSRGPPRWRE